ncbi:MAG: hypothetical protein QS721_13095 [Candidatus Endonucleobacter sp. (ex Gigantidas childressi)]|nr:hypothetical protein [Candidatus Endonucleobacter sp. (ex Gigantidas childressi)]
MSALSFYRMGGLFCQFIGVDSCSECHGRRRDENYSCRMKCIKIEQTGT